MLNFVYKNHRGEVEERTVVPIALEFIPSPHLEYGYSPGWFLKCRDYSRGRKGDIRSFSLSHIQMTGFNTEAAGQLGQTAFSLPLTFED